jgi:hypothetical protein
MADGAREGRQQGEQIERRPHLLRLVRRCVYSAGERRATL